MWNAPFKLVLVAALACGIPLSARAEGQDAAVVQKLAHGEVNWSTKTITATGSGAANAKAASVAVARLNAERAAKLDALRNIVETLQGIQVTGKRSAEDLMSNGEVKTKVQGFAKGFQVVDTRYYSDGSVDLVVQMPLNAELGQAFMEGVPELKKPKKLNGAGAADVTGLVINAKGLGLVPSIAPRILDESGKEVFSATMVDTTGLTEGGVTGYGVDVEDAKKNSRVGEKPLVVRALALADKTKSDLVISNADADRLRDRSLNQSFLMQARVIIVLD